MTSGGGAIYRNVTSGSGGILSIDNCTFINNTFPIYGGAIYNSASRITINNTIFTNNREINCGTVYSHSDVPNLVIINCIFNRNSAYASSGSSIYGWSNIFKWPYFCF
ncbi:hypothetical protein ALNOE001_20120 [Candidatus Methanobinarius endosymbioticus]|uniref:Right handed beta helix domain-containing protein n=1 Tax=Candidatus Methanobinarius endosymbioticus TaxID=2006182 RepID=A0A366M9W0_9EURY|nr:hypothetical protein ALNOE001_20120 [Candidatus Methanobinarius endosymbioticus]